MDLPSLLVLGLWSLFAVATAMRLRRRGAQTFDDRFTPSDRRLVGAAAFYLTAPALVLASQGLTVGAVYLAGGQLGTFESWVFWGTVEPAAPLPPLTRAAIALVAPIFLTTLALLLVWRTSSKPSGAAQNFYRLELARMLGTLALGVHPIVSTLARRGDHHALRESLNTVREPVGDAAILLYAIGAAYAVWQWRRARRLRALATPLHDAVRSAEGRLAKDPADADAARLLGAARLAMGDPKAIAAIERASKLAPDDPRVELLQGQAFLRTGAPQEASQHLRRAGQLFEEQDADDRSLLFEIELALSAARIAIGDAEGAVLTAEAARETMPGDPRGLLVLVDALVAMGRRDEARTKLEGAVGSASGRLKREIERRLSALRRKP